MLFDVWTHRMRYFLFYCAVNNILDSNLASLTLIVKLLKVPNITLLGQFVCLCEVLVFKILIILLERFSLLFKILT